MHSTRRNPISLPPTRYSALSHHAHFQTISTGNSTVFFSSILVQVCRPQKHLTMPTNGSSVTVHADFVFERNIGVLHKMFYLMSCIFFFFFLLFLFLFCFCFVSKYVLHIHTTIQSGILDQWGGTG